MEKAYFLFLVTLVASLGTASSSITNVVAHNNSRDNDLDALLALKATISDPQNILPINWSTSTSVCNWIGITCNTRHRRVAAIQLPTMGLVGTIPPQLGNLSFLVWLNLQNNSFHGNLPTQLVHLRRLKYFNLAFNSFDGEFPSWLGALSRLRYLSFHSNRISGSLPPTLSNATTLETIRLGLNLITGNLPQDWSALQNLEDLDMQSNRLDGSLPRSLFNLSSLQHFRFTNNTLSGYLPVRICDHLPQLVGLYLSRNEFNGEVPAGIGGCPRLQILSLSYNNLAGNIPKEIWNLTTLWGLALGENDIQGQIPAEIGNNTNLEVLGIEDANLTGVIPREIGNLHKLEVLYLGKNRLRNPIPHELFNISTLGALCIPDNDFSGILPSTLGVNLPNLEVLNLGSNKFTGIILPTLSNASKLMSLDLTVNEFFGAIPDSLGSLTFLEALDLSENNFTLSRDMTFFNSIGNCRSLIRLSLDENPLNGNLPVSIGNLSNSLESIDVSYCGIGGEIPRSLGNLSNLAYLNIASNGLTGTTPSSISGLLKLQWISLEDNKIHGPIPSEFCHIPNLAYLILARNRLSGKVPNCIGSISSLRYLYLNSNNLTSSVPSSLWSLKDLLELDLSMNYLNGSLSSQVGGMKALIKLNLSVNQLSADIPSTIGALQNLQALSLGHNNLQGLIPESIKNMFVLQYLDLSFNSLTGTIPKSLEALLDLQYLNVSFNNLQGPIPQGGPFKNFTLLSFLANEALCGTPWFQPCQTSQHRSKKKMLLLVCLPTGSAVLALAVSLLLLKRLTRNKTMAPVHDIFPETTHQRVPYHELQRITNGFSENNLLGSGTFGSVYKGVSANGMIWAIKVFDMQLEGILKAFDTECEVLCRLRHRNLIKVISACSNQDFKALILEFMPNGSLEKWLHLGHHVLSIMQRLDIMIDVAHGLEYLHYGYSFPIIHCDLKPSNILLDEDMVGHVSDFGIAKLLGDEESRVQTNTLATIGYIAPEHGLEGLVSTRCDVYSFGITMIEAFTGKRPKDEMFKEELSIRRWIEELLPGFVDQVIDVKLLHLEDKQAEENKACVSSILQLALRCTSDVPENRINIKDAVTTLEKIKTQFFQRN
ncbi:probable LRR receptor-like serine/threonine-protein kinase At3g47570 [Coffea eugenioides]|uniref:probable LRR receptor-like serine/threonine-protein kinase At3g47570 n=1 Tax=Coffea eugenioides TaxID=49369 RepID=UPI000F60E4CB|nr:probable LRR receptor-like serine/threonine-protein kinase At3g47570 [Coffea eugenioides]